MSSLSTSHIISSLSLNTYFPNDLSVLIVDYFSTPCFLDKNCRCNNPIEHLDVIYKFIGDVKVSGYIMFRCRFTIFEGNCKFKAQDKYSGYESYARTYEFYSATPAYYFVNKAACFNCGNSRLTSVPNMQHCTFTCELCDWIIQMEDTDNKLALIYANVKYRYELMNGKELTIG